MAIRNMINRAGWLALIQLSTYLLPIVTLPVVTRALGPSLFGTLSAISATAAYVGLLVSYGFNYTGPRLIATLRDEPAKLVEALSAVICVQFSLGAIGASLYLFMIEIYATDYKLVSAIILLQACSISINLDWVFLVFDRMRDFAMLQVIVKAIAAGLILTLIRTPSDALLYVTINAGAAVVVAYGSFTILQRSGIRWHIPSYRIIGSTMRQSTAMFLSTLSVSLYTTTNVIITNLILGPTAAGLFALADRLRSAMTNILGPITTAVFPFVCRLSAQPITHEESQLKRLLFLLIMTIAIMLSVFLFVFAPLIVSIVAGPAFSESVPIVRIMAAVPVFVALSNILGVQTMVPLGMDRILTLIFAFTALVNFGGLLILSNAFGLHGAALAVLGSEIFVALLLIFVLAKKMRVISLFFA
jgi:PST family polysaccharide transporter